MHASEVYRKITAVCTWVSDEMLLRHYCQTCNTVRANNVHDEEKYGWSSVITDDLIHFDDELIKKTDI